MKNVHYKLMSENALLKRHKDILKIFMIYCDLPIYYDICHLLRQL